MGRQFRPTILFFFMSINFVFIKRTNAWYILYIHNIQLFSFLTLYSNSLGFGICSFFPNSLSTTAANLFIIFPSSSRSCNDPTNWIGLTWSFNLDKIILLPIKSLTPNLAWRTACPEYKSLSSTTLAPIELIVVSRLAASLTSIGCRS